MWPAAVVSAARTVAAVAPHFEALKARARTLVEQGTATRRGYFLPSEDEEVRHLLVSYWHARRALFELVESAQRDTALLTLHRPAVFLPAYAAALLLVDAGRFLREEFNANHLIRGKLNEAEPAFGIPAGVYDQVQRSLTSARHAWRLYHALEYFDQHRGELAELGADPCLNPCWQVIERLHERTRVAVTAFYGTRLRVKARAVRQVLDQQLVGRALYGLLKLSGSLLANRYTKRGHRPALPASIDRQLRGLLQMGDVIIVRKEYALTNYFLPGYWPHAALFVGTVEELLQAGLANHEHVAPRWERLLAADTAHSARVIEAMKDGVWIRSLGSPFASDAVLLLRPRLRPEEVAAGVARAFFHESKPYDFDFDFTRADRLVCTEVVYRSYDGLGEMSFPLSRRAGRLTLAAEDLISMALAGKGFDPVAVYAPQFSTTVEQGAAAARILAAARRS